jgi:TRAP-type C4-dicarboxylate transport system permease small subunit
MIAFAHAVRRLSNACAFVAAVLLALAVLIICYMIVRRALGHSSFWEIELSIYLTVAATFLASPYTLRTGGHVSVDLIPDLLHGRTRELFMRGLQVIGCLVCLYLAWEGWRLTHEAYLADERSISMWRPPRWPMYAMMPLGMALTALQYLSDLFVPASDEAPKPPHAEIGTA